MRPCFLLEPLEPRFTLSAGFIAADGLPGGAVPLDLGPGAPWGPLFLFQPDGKIIATDHDPDSGPTCYDSDGYDFTGRTFFVRFNTNGTRDMSFADNGVANISCAEESLDQILRQSDGKILAMTDQGGLVRFTSDGRLDHTFQTLPGLPPPYSDDNFDPARIAITPDGSILVGGERWGYDDSSYFALVRFKPNGAPDLSFGTQGAVDRRYANRFAWAGRLTLQADGKILAITSDHGDDFNRRPSSLLRFNSNGTPDETFARNGQFRLPNTGSDGTILLQPDGKIIVAVDYVDHRLHPSAPDLTLLRLNSDGTLDESFGDHGRALSWWHDYDFWSAILQPDGKILAIGDGILARFTSTGILDPTFGFDGAMQINFADPRFDFAIDNWSLRPNGHLFLFGQKENCRFGCNQFTEYLLDITTDPSQSSRTSSSDGSILIRPFAPESVTTPPFASFDAPATSGSAIPVVSDSTPDVLQQDSDDPLASDDAHSELWLD